MHIYIYIHRERERERCISIYIYIYIYTCSTAEHTSVLAKNMLCAYYNSTDIAILVIVQFRMHDLVVTGQLPTTHVCHRKPAISFHNFKSQNFKLSVSNPKSKYVAYVSVLSRISNYQGLGRKNKHDILKTDRTPVSVSDAALPLF